MREKNGLKTFAGKKLKQNRRSCLGGLGEPASTVSDSLIQLKPDRKSQVLSDSLLQQQDQLRNEIRRGKEYLQQLQKNLDESRTSLEQWNRYELISSIHPLDHLIETMSLQERTQQFLVGWLKRQEQKLAKVTEDIESRIRKAPQAAASV